MKLRFKFAVTGFILVIISYIWSIVTNNAPSTLIPVVLGMFCLIGASV